MKNCFKFHFSIFRILKSSSFCLILACELLFYHFPSFMNIYLNLLETGVAAAVNGWLRDLKGRREAATSHLSDRRPTCLKTAIRAGLRWGGVLVGPWTRSAGRSSQTDKAEWRTKPKYDQNTSLEEETRNSQTKEVQSRLDWTNKSADNNPALNILKYRLYLLHHRVKG